MLNVKEFTYEIFDTGNVAAFVPFHEGKANAGDQTVIQQESVAATPPAATFSAEELEVAKNLAKAEGIEEGYKKAKEQFEAEQAEKNTNLDVLITGLVARINGLERQIEARKDILTRDFAELAVSLAKHIISNLPEDTLTKQTESLIKEAISGLDDTQKIKIRLNSKNAAELNDKFTGITLIPVDDMAPGEFKVQWQNGYLERDTKKLWSNMEEVLNKHFTNHHHIEDNAETHNNEEQITTNNEA